jgi:hypothetical protein
MRSADELGIDPDRLDRVRASFLIGEASDLFVPLDAWAPRQEAIAASLSAFRSNLQSAASVGSVLFTMAHSGVMERRFALIHTSERIRQLDPDHRDLDDAREETALTLARARMDKDLQDQPFMNGIIREIINALHQRLEDAEMRQAAQELLRQTAVMIWGALEVIATDIIIEVLNRCPALFNEALTGETLKRLGLGKAVPVEVLHSYGFNISASMGTIFFGERRLDTLPAIAAVCDDLFANQALNLKLKSTGIWTLFQRRHLIVHRRGIVDAQYLARTPDSFAPGEPLIVSAGDLHEPRPTTLRPSRTSTTLPRCAMSGLKSLSARMVC